MLSLLSLWTYIFFNSFIIISHHHQIEGPSWLHKNLKRITFPPSAISASACLAGTASFPTYLRITSSPSAPSLLPPTSWQLLICNTKKLTLLASRLPMRTPAMSELSGDCKVQSTAKQLISRILGDICFLGVFFWWILTSGASSSSGEWPFTPAHLWVLLLYMNQNTSSSQKKKKKVKMWRMSMDYFTPSFSKYTTLKYSAPCLPSTAFSLRINYFRTPKRTDFYRKN